MFLKQKSRNHPFFRQVLLLWLLIWGIPAFAHTASENNLQLLVDDNELIFNITVDMEVLNRLDSNGDGLLGRDELRAQRTEYEVYLAETLKFLDQNAVQGELFFNDVMTNKDDADANQGRVEHARMFRRYRFPEPLEQLDMRLTAFSSITEPLRVTLVNKDQVREWTLSPEQPELKIYLGERQRVSQVADWMVIGTKHILFGIDHLLVLLILVFGCLSFWRVLGLATAFTLGHSITLASAYLGWMSLPGAWVEFGIALTLVYAAVRRLSSASLAATEGWLVVLFIGLIHGFGFAGSFANYPISIGSELLTVLSFNVGVEVGQVIALIPIVLASWLTYKVTESRRPSQAIATAVLMAGMFFTVTRVPMLAG